MSLVQHSPGRKDSNELVQLGGRGAVDEWTDERQTEEETDEEWRTEDTGRHVPPPSGSVATVR